MNKVILIGRVGADAKVSRFDSGAVSMTFSLATTERRKDKDGNKHEDTQWHNVVMWGDRAEKLAPFITKGLLLCVEGSVRYRSSDKDGQKRYFTDIACREIEFLSSKRQEGAQPATMQPQQQPPQPAVNVYSPPPQQPQYAMPQMPPSPPIYPPTEEDMMPSDDLPF